MFAILKKHIAHFESTLDKQRKRFLMIYSGILLLFCFRNLQSKFFECFMKKAKIFSTVNSRYCSLLIQH